MKPRGNPNRQEFGRRRVRVEARGQETKATDWTSLVDGKIEVPFGRGKKKRGRQEGKSKNRGSQLAENVG